MHSQTDGGWLKSEGAGLQKHLGGLVPLVALSVVALGGWLFLQPYFVLGHIRQAAKRGDRDALAELIDFPALRENLKASLNAHAVKSMSEQGDNPFAGLGLLLAGAFVDRVVDAYVTPSGIAMLASGQRPDADDSAAGPGHDRVVKVTQRYRSPSVFLATVPADSSGETGITFVLHRRGLAWVLTDIRLPTLGDPRPNAGISETGSVARFPSGSSVRALPKSGRQAEDATGLDPEPTVVRVKGTDEQVVVVPPTDDELPKFGAYVYVDELPEAITRVPPEYPERARAAGVDGTVLVQALVGKDGRVRDVRIQKSIPLLDAAAREAVSAWVFKPALSAGQPVAVWVAVPVKFTLN